MIWAGEVLLQVVMPHRIPIIQLAKLQVLKCWNLLILKIVLACQQRHILQIVILSWTNQEYSDSIWNIMSSIFLCLKSVTILNMVYQSEESPSFIITNTQNPELKIVAKPSL